MSNIKKSVTTLFVDLDGTLTDPSAGITRCMQHALECLGRSYPGQAELRRYIGPPLRWTFPRLLGSDDADLVETAIGHFRRRYGTVGLFENDPYPGVAELLSSLRADGYTLYVVTSKPKVYADRILAHFGLDRYFIEVFGPDLDGRFDEKRELVQFVLRHVGAEAKQTVMIGDRARDIESGKAHGTLTIGVTYGFGSEEELIAAKPDAICHSPSEIDGALSDLSAAERRNA